MQDNARIYTAKIIKKWFKDESISLIEWPLYSLNLNLIKHLWAVLKQWIHKHYPDLVDMGESEQAY
jgi:transposase